MDNDNDFDASGHMQVTRARLSDGPVGSMDEGDLRAATTALEGLADVLYVTSATDLDGDPVSYGLDARDAGENGGGKVGHGSGGVIPLRAAQ